MKFDPFDLDNDGKSGTARDFAIYDANFGDSDDDDSDDMDFDDDDSDDDPDDDEEEERNRRKDEKQIRRYAAKANALSRKLQSIRDQLIESVDESSFNSDDPSRYDVVSDPLNSLQDWLSDQLSEIDSMVSDLEDIDTDVY